MKVNVTEKQALDIFKFLGKRIDKSFYPIIQVCFNESNKIYYYFGYINDRNVFYNVWIGNNYPTAFLTDARTYCGILKNCLKIVQDYELIMLGKSFLRKGITLEQVLLEMDLANGCF